MLQSGIAHARRGFTLIELLVVISIIAILAAMLLPAIRMVRSTARSVVCMSNLRQCGMAISAYADDYNGMYLPSRAYAPGSPYWMQSLGPYITRNDNDLTGNVGLAEARDGTSVMNACPEWKALNSGVVRGAANVDSLVGYALSSRPQLPTSITGEATTWIPGFSVLTGTPPAGGTLYREFPLTSITQRTRRVILGDFMGHDLNALSWNAASYSDELYRDGLAKNGTLGFGTNRHGNKANWLFADLHVDNLSSVQARQSYKDPSKLAD